MTNEKKLVVNPLIRWFKKHKTKWICYSPNFETAATGWDIEVQRKNQDLLIEAKYIDGSFLASLNGLVTAPLAKRKQHLIKRKYRSSSYGVCWAIGTNYNKRNIYQLLFDYFSRNPLFWRHYAKDLQMKYIYFVKNDRIFQILFKKLLTISNQYSKITKKQMVLGERRNIANKLITKIEKFT